MAETKTKSASRGVTTTTWTVKINNTEVPKNIHASNIFIRKEINAVPVAKLDFVLKNTPAQKFELSSDELFKPGNEIEIIANSGLEKNILFKGIIIKQALKIKKENSVLSVECQDKSFTMTVGRKNAFFHEMKDSDVYSTIVRSYRIQADIESTEVVHKELVQFNCTDWNFMVTRADVNGRVCIADDGRLVIRKPNLKADAVLSLAFGSSILELDAEIDARLQFKNVKAVSWDSDNQQLTEATAKNPGIKLNGNSDLSELANVAGLKEYVLKHGGSIEKEELQVWSNAWWTRHQLARIRGRVRFNGTHVIKPGNLIELTGLGDRFNGKSFVNGIEHQITAGSWQTVAQIGINPDLFINEVENTSAAASGLIPAIGGLQIGKVTKLENDPEGRSRIQILLPIIANDAKGIWARVGTLDAGDLRGSFFLPEIGDEVIVGFINNDPRDAIVLGMMHSSAKPAPLQAQDLNPKKGFISRSGMKLIFDDNDKSFTVETPLGNKIVLDEDARVLKLEDQNGNKIMMDQGGIVIESIKSILMKSATDFKLDASNVLIKSNAGIKTESGGSTEIKSSATLSIKGSVVNIN